MMNLHVRREDYEDDSCLYTSEHHQSGENFFVPSSGEAKENQIGEKFFIIKPPSKISNNSLRRTSSLSLLDLLAPSRISVYRSEG